LEALPERPIWTYIFIASCTIMFIFQQLSNLWWYLAFFPAYSLQLPWSFITSIFLHADIEHLLFNMIALFFFGYSLEIMLGRRLFVLIFFLSGIFGNIGYLLTSIIGITSMTIPAIGASGAIYGVLGTIVVLTPLKRVFLYGFFPLPLVLVVVFWIFLDIIGLFAPSGIAHGAHLGGIIVGALAGFYFRKKMVRVQYYTG